MFSELLLALPFVIILLALSGYFSSNINSQSKKKVNSITKSNDFNKAILNENVDVVTKAKLPPLAPSIKPIKEITPKKDSLAIIIKNSFSELETYGYSYSYDNFEKVFRVSKGTDDNWFICYTLGYNHSSKRKNLNLSKMPNLNSLLARMESIDSDLRSEGGRVLISKNKVYRKRV